ncbi:hypothetical protein KW785_01650 [Candidatus Parcubacteria bacterium]|nr:hypothetical protein [Candidatus Parcubacteria bacterium]
MSKRHLESLLKEELGSVNDLIDRKIIKGLSYAREARRHKFITARLRQLHKQTHPSWLSRLGLRTYTSA